MIMADTRGWDSLPIKLRFIFWNVTGCALLREILFHQFCPYLSRDHFYYVHISLSQDVLFLIVYKQCFSITFKVRTLKFGDFWHLYNLVRLKMLKTKFYLFFLKKKTLIRVAFFYKKVFFFCSLMFLI